MDYKLAFLCGARDFHAMDWYRNAKILHPDKNISIVTDLISSEGFNSLLNQTDTVHKLLILDRFLDINNATSLLTAPFFFIIDIGILRIKFFDLFE